MYEALPKKRGFWSKVGKPMGKTGKWANKHYLNSFRRVLYDDELTDKDKEHINNYISKNYQYSPDEHIRAQRRQKTKTELKRYFEENSRDLFVGELDSYIYQALNNAEEK